MEIKYSPHWEGVTIRYHSYDDAYNPVKHEFTGDVLYHKSVLKSIFSDVEINFNPQDITSVTSKEVDKKHHSSIKSDASLATNIAQLLIDIKALDDADLSAWVEENPQKIPPDEMKNIRMNRFNNAFHFMFPSKRFKKIDNKDGRKVILFQDHGKEIRLNELSSGEKQIVYQDSFLLKDIKSNSGILVLIDEPEISLHPSWQLKILNFFKKLFTTEEGIQRSKLVVVTHSPFIIQGPKRGNEKVLVLLKDEKGKVAVASEPEFYGWTEEKIIQAAFNLEMERSEKPIILVEGETDEKYLNKAMVLFDITCIGRTIENGNKVFTGESSLTQAKNFLIANTSYLLHRKTVILYDSDTKAKPEDYENNCYLLSIL